ncbi:MAG: lamin tail domain-containing protein [Cytophagales bacterium]
MDRIKTIASSILCILGLMANAQIVDDFSDGELQNNPTWSGLTSCYTVNGLGQLQLNAPGAGNCTIETPLVLTTLGGVEWNFSLRQNFSPSNSNFTKVYLVANTYDLSATTLNGYYLRFGKDLSADVVEFYRQNGAVNTLVASGTTNISTSHNIEIKVKRDNVAQWSLFVKTATSINFGAPEAVFTEGTYTSSKHFIFNNIVTASFVKNIYLDNIFVSTITDNLAISILGYNIENSNTINIDLSEKPKLPILGKYGVFDLDNNSVESMSLSNTSLIISYANSFLSNNTISISGIADLSGNLMSPTAIDFVSTLVSPPITNTGNALNYRDITINELMADVNPAPNDIPAFEYLELYNNTDNAINLLGDTIIDGSTKRPLTRNFSIVGNGFGIIVATENARTQLLTQFPTLNIYTLLGFGLTDGGETITFKDRTGKTIDQISYKSSWYKDTDRNDGGFSLEQINPKNPCSGEANWKATTNENGGTPGTQNSVFSNQSEAPQIKNIVTKNTFQLEVIFNQPMDTSTFKTGSYLFGNNVTAYLPVPYNYKQDTLKLFTSINLTEGRPYQFTISGIKNCEGIGISDTISTIGLARLPQVGEIIINEVMAQPEPQVGLPPAEYIELYNTTSDLLDVSNFKIKDATASSNGKIAPNSIIEPSKYLLLTSETNANLFSGTGKIAVVSSFPSLNKTGDLLTLIDLKTVTIDQINYKPDWYKNDSKAEGGWSLERINPSKNCGGKYNWAASKDAKGGTPNSINSIFSIAQDSAKPLINSILINNSSAINVVFSEGIDHQNLLSAVTISDRNISDASLSIQNADTSFINLATPLLEGKSYTIQIQDLYDCSGNKLDIYTQTIGVGRKPKPFDVVINEIMADENPVKNLPEAEFIELFNNTSDLLDLSNFKIFDATTVPGRMPSSAVIKPNGYLILCNTSNVANFKPYGDTYGVVSFPSLNSSGDLIKLVSPENITISKVNYIDTWYRDEEKKDGGWTLEQIDPLNPCGTANNWLASSNSLGGTPGKVNSNFAVNPDNSPPLAIRAFASSKDSLLLYFNEPIDSLSASNAAYTISNGINAEVLAIETDKILLKLSPSIITNQNYSVSVSQIKDCVGNFIATPNSSSFIQAEKADSFDLIINEVLFNPRTGGSDFVEVYNRSNKNINIKNWHFANVVGDIVGSYREITTENTLIQPKTYRVFTDNAANVKNNYPNAIDTNFIEIESLPSYNDDKSTVVLVNENFKIIDLFQYEDDYHLKLIDDKEGVSLERVNFDLPTNTPENWASASQNSGFATPGFQNSQISNFTIADKVVDITPKVFSPDQDGYLDFTTITFNSTDISNVANITIYDLEGRVIKKLVKNQNVGNQSFFQWDGLDELGRKALVGNYMIYIEVFNLKGETKSFKENVVVAARF